MRGTKVGHIGKESIRICNYMLWENVLVYIKKDVFVANTLYPYKWSRPVFEYYNKWPLHVPCTCIKEYLYYVTNQQMIINNTSFFQILLFIGMFQSLLRPSTGCYARIQTIYNFFHKIYK